MIEPKGNKAMMSMQAGRVRSSLRTDCAFGLSGPQSTADPTPLPCRGAAIHSRVIIDLHSSTGGEMYCTATEGNSIRCQPRGKSVESEANPMRVIQSALVVAALMLWL